MIACQGKPANGLGSITMTDKTPRFKHVEHPLGWRPIDANHPFYVVGPRNWVKVWGKGAALEYEPGDKKLRVAHRGKYRLWQFAPDSVPKEKLEDWASYAHRAQFWAIPLVEAAVKAVHPKATAADIAELRKYVDKIGDWK